MIGGQIRKHVAIVSATLVCQAELSGGAEAQAWEAYGAGGVCELVAADAGYRLVLAFESDGRVGMSYTDERLAGRIRGETPATLSIVGRDGKTIDLRARGVLKQAADGPFLTATVVAEIPTDDFGALVIDGLRRTSRIVVAVPKAGSERVIEIAAASASLDEAAACHR